MIFTVLALTAAIPDEPRLAIAVRQAIEDEIQHGLDATINKDMDAYMAGVPDDYSIVEDDGTVTDKARLRELQAQAWALISRTNRLDIKITGLQLGCGGDCAFVKTDQLWDRQMLGKDGKTEFNVVTTQGHDEKWELRDSRWRQTVIKELGGTVTVDGKPY
jgi:ketosteroid isomerase-like protein